MQWRYFAYTSKINSQAASDRNVKTIKWQIVSELWWDDLRDDLPSHKNQGKYADRNEI